MNIPGRLAWSLFRAPVKGMLGETAVKAVTGLALPSTVYRQLHNEVKSGGNQPADISRIHRRHKPLPSAFVF